MRYLRGAKSSGKGGGGGEQANTLNSLATAKMIEVVSFGECWGLFDTTHPLKSVYFDNTAANNQDGTSNFLGVSVDQRTGLPDQAPFTGFSDTETTFSNGTTITHATPVIYTVVDDFIDAVRFTIDIPALTQQNTSTGELTGSSVSYTFSSQIVGGAWTDIITENLNAKCTSQQELSYRIERPVGAGDTTSWAVRVTRNTADSTSVFNQNLIILDNVVEIVDSNLQYADLACVALMIDSQQFGSTIPARSFDFGGMILDVPSNYTPPDIANPNDVTKRTYTGLWDGTFKRAWSDNPAWILWACLTDKTWGLGNAIDTEQIDKWALYQIAQYCDGWVDDGTGTSTLEPRYVINTQVTDSQDAYAMLQTIASVFHGLVYWGTGSASFVADQPRDPVKIVTQANVIDGVFTYQGAALKARHSVVQVTWNDPTNNWAQTVEAVEDAALLNRLGWRPVQMIAFGVTSKGQASRFGRWVLETEAQESESVTYETSFEQQDLRPGDIVAIYDPTWAGVRMGGRCTAVTGTSMTIDSAFTIAAATTYTLTMLGPDMRLISRTLTNGTGAASTLTWTGTIAAKPANSSTVTIQAVNTPAPVQFQQINAVTSTSVTCEQSVVLLNGVAYELTFTLPNETTEVRPLTTTISSGIQIGSSNYYELQVLGWSSALGTLPNVNSTFFVGPSSEGGSTHTVGVCSSASCTITSPFTFVAGYTYTATWTLPDGSLIERQLTNAAGSTSTLTWEGNLDDLPVVGSLWAITSSALAPRQFRVISVKEKEPNIFEVSALLYNPDKYSAIEDGRTLATPVTSVFQSNTKPDPITDLTAARNPVLQSDGSYQDTILIMWKASDSVLVNTYLVSYQYQTNPWVQLPNSMGGSASFKSNGPGNYTFKVIAQTFLGLQSVATTITLELDDSRPFDGATIGNIYLVNNPISVAALDASRVDTLATFVTYGVL